MDTGCSYLPSSLLCSHLCLPPSSIWFVSWPFSKLYLSSWQLTEFTQTLVSNCRSLPPCSLITILTTHICNAHDLSLALLPFLTSLSIFPDAIPSTGTQWCLPEPPWPALAHHFHIYIIECSRWEFVACFTCADQTSSPLCTVILSTVTLFGLLLIIKEPGSQSDQEKSAVANAFSAVRAIDPHSSGRSDNI